MSITRCVRPMKRIKSPLICLALSVVAFLGSGRWDSGFHHLDDLCARMATSLTTSTCRRHHRGKRSLGVYRRTRATASRHLVCTCWTIVVRPDPAESLGQPRVPRRQHAAALYRVTDDDRRMWWQCPGGALFALHPLRWSPWPGSPNARCVRRLLLSADVARVCKSRVGQQGARYQLSGIRVSGGRGQGQG